MPDPWEQYLKPPANAPSSLAGDIAGGAWAATKGAAKGAVGDVVGAGQIASDIPGVKSALKSIPGLAENAREVRDWSRSRDPNYPKMGEAGRMVGAAAPIAAAMPLTGLGALADAAAFGGLSGLVQPTRGGGDWTTDIPEHAKESIKGGLYGEIPVMGGYGLRALAPLGGLLSRYGLPYLIGKLLGHPYIGMHFGGNTATMKAAQPAVKGLTTRIGESMVPGEHYPSWGSYTKAPFGNVWRTPLGPPVPKGRMPAAMGGAEAEEPQAGKTDDPLGYLRSGER